MRKLGRNTLDTITGMFEDPFSPSESVNKGITKPSGGSKLGMMAAALPAAPKGLKLAPIAPEAYADVKAGGYRLYSRLTDAFAKAPPVMNPDKVRSIAKQGASAEEVGLRKLEQLLTGKQPMDKINRQDVMGHLAANPLELDIKHRGASAPKAKMGETGLVPEDADIAHQAFSQAQQRVNVVRHDFDTRYGANWEESELDVEDMARWHQVLEEENTTATAYQDARTQAQWNADYPDTHAIEQGTNPIYDWMQSPGAKENYGETLINLPTKELDEVKRLQTEYAQTHDPRADGYYDSGSGAMRENSYMAPLAKRQKELETNVYRAPHFPDDPNNLVWSRHNERRLEPTSSTPDMPAQTTYPSDTEMTWKPPQDATAKGGSKGLLTEEIQSDWGAAGREHGFNTPDEQARRADAQAAINQRWQALDDYLSQVIDQNPDELGHINKNWERHGKANGVRMAFPQGSPERRHIAALEDLAAEADKHWNDNYTHDPVPDMPYKDNYHELQIKTDLLDAANDPSIEWYGINDAHTNAALEGHDYTKAGSQLGYDEKHPKTLKDLITPFGGSVEHVEAPWQNSGANNAQKFENYGTSIYPPDPKKPARNGSERVVDYHSNPGQGTHVMDTIPPYPAQPGYSVDHNEYIREAIKDLAKSQGQRANLAPRTQASLWKAPLTPEMKKLMAERGFSAMALLAAMQQGNLFGRKDEQ